MQSDSSQPYGAPFLIVLASLVVIVAGMRTTAPILIPFLLSVFIAVISAPPLFWLRRKGLPTVLALPVVITIIFVAILFVTALIGTSLSDFSRNLPSYQERLIEVTGGVALMLEKRGINIPGVRSPGALVAEHINPGAAMRAFTSALTSLGDVLTNTFLIILTVVIIRPALAHLESLPKAYLLCSRLSEHAVYLTRIFS